MDLPINSMVIFHSYVNVYQKVKIRKYKNYYQYLSIGYVKLCKCQNVMMDKRITHVYFNVCLPVVIDQQWTHRQMLRNHSRSDHAKLVGCNVAMIWVNYKISLFGDDFPNPNHDSRVPENSEVVIIYRTQNDPPFLGFQGFFGFGY